MISACIEERRLKLQSNSNGICRALSGPDDIRESYNEDLFKGGHTLFREEKK